MASSEPDDLQIYSQYSADSALQILHGSRDEIEKLIADYDQGPRTGETPARRAERIITQLTRHHRWLSDAVLPAMRAAGHEDAAEQLGREAQQVMDQLRTTDAAAEMGNARFRSLVELFIHDVGQKETRLLEQAAEGGVDLEDLGRRMREGR